MKLLLDVAASATTEEKAKALKDCIMSGQVKHNIFMFTGGFINVGTHQLQQLTSANQFMSKHPELFEDLEE